MQNYKRYIARGKGIFVPLKSFKFETNLFTDYVLTNLIEQKEFKIIFDNDDLVIEHPDQDIIINLEERVDISSILQQEIISILIVVSRIT